MAKEAANLKLPAYETKLLVSAITSSTKNSRINSDSYSPVNIVSLLVLPFISLV